MPAGVAHQIERIMRNFLWLGVGNDKTTHLINWEICLWPKNEGGLGLGNLLSKNIALSTK